MKKILFILKKRSSYGPYSHTSFSSGLLNSAAFVADMLDSLEGVDTQLVEVVDNNEIDKYVTEYQPDTVIIEALWVVPEKFEVLQKLHPDVKWIVRLHSDTPFLAGEGVAVDWLFRYGAYSNVSIAANSTYAVYSLGHMLKRPVIYLPNYYPIDSLHNRDIHIGCFGAIRPMKNTLTQAIAAVDYADATNRKLFFHINTGRVEHGESNLKNIRALFAHVPHELVEHGWMTHDKFIALVKTMDLGLQVSLSETYNIVAADFVSQNIPIVVSKDITFITSGCQVDNTKDVQEIVRALYYAERNAFDVAQMNTMLLSQNAEQAKMDWVDYIYSVKKKADDGATNT